MRAIGILGFGVLRFCGLRVLGFHGCLGLVGFQALGFRVIDFRFRILRAIGILGFGVLRFCGLRGSRLPWVFRACWVFKLWGFRVIDFRCLGS